ncbi:MAG: polysaccharide biosynthesis tyrosine autokinase, partial [Phycisphaerae bacterium]|nr:polysaccharide biosynthesis tyrosine autokinase [Phycisphaerae bacterium]
MISKLQGLVTQITGLEQARDQREAALRAVKEQKEAGTLAKSFEVLVMLQNDPMLRNLRFTQMEISTRRDSLLEKWGEDHPRIEELDARLKQIEPKIEAREKELEGEYVPQLVDQQERLLASVKTRLLGLQKEYDDGMTVAADLETQLATINALIVDERLVTEKIGRMEQRLFELRTQFQRERPIEMQVPASEPTEIAMPKWGTMIPMGFLLGLVFGLATAFLVEFIDTSIKNPSDITRRVDLPLLGMVPHTDDLEEEIEDLRLAFMTNPNSLIGEAFRQIRTCLLFSGPASQRRSLLVTSAMPEDGRGTVVMNLAASFAHSGRNVLVVDTNFRQPMIRKLFPGCPESGLSDALVGQANWADLTHSVEPNLHVMSSGPLPPNPAELLGSDQMQQIVSDMVEKYDQVIFDGAPSLVVTDSPVLSTCVDGVVLVVRAGANTYG